MVKIMVKAVRWMRRGPVSFFFHLKRLAVVHFITNGLVSVAIYIAFPQPLVGAYPPPPNSSVFKCKRSLCSPHQP